MSSQAMLISGGLFVVCVALLYLWLRAERRLRSVEDE